jgi:hypothetical protein
MEGTDGLRRCGRCGKLKLIADFNWRRKTRGQRDNLCRPCRSEYHREHYLANKQRYIEQAAASQHRLRLERTWYLIEYFKTHPCADCGEDDPIVLEFDHLEDKCFDIAQALPYRSWQTILDEIEKCEVVCANCHRRRTVQRKPTVRSMLADGRLL